MNLRYVSLDVFTDRMFAGNPLAVLLDARALDDASMLAIAREFNYSETTFVLPPRHPDAIRRVRIFTPGGELAFAGHPIVGTATALVREGVVPMVDDAASFVFDLEAGLTQVCVRMVAGAPLVTFTAPRAPAISVTTQPAQVAAALGIDATCVDTTAHAPVDVGTGLDFVVARLRDLQALADAAVQPQAWSGLSSPGASHGIVVYVPVTGDRLRVRVFAPGAGVTEDPGTGSAAAALGALLAGLDRRHDAALAWTIDQGVEMGRPSRIEVEVDKRDDKIDAVRIGGSAVAVMEGRIDL